MSDTYQPVYDATRSRIQSCDTASVIGDAVANAFDMSHARQMLQAAIAQVEFSLTRPSVLMRPSVALDGNKWCALYGPNLMEGVCGFGDSPEEACAAFDAAWNGAKP